MIRLWKMFVTLSLLIAAPFAWAQAEVEPCEGVVRIRIDQRIDPDIRRTQLLNYLNNIEPYQSNGRYELCFDFEGRAVEFNTDQREKILFSPTQLQHNFPIVISGLRLSNAGTQNNTPQPLLTINSQNRVILHDIEIIGVRDGVHLVGGPHEIRGGIIEGLASRAEVGVGVGIQANNAVISGTEIRNFSKGVAIAANDVVFKNGCSIHHNQIGIHIRNPFKRIDFQNCKTELNGNPIRELRRGDALRFELEDIPEIGFFVERGGVQREKMPNQEGVIVFSENETPVLRLHEDYVPSSQPNSNTPLEMNDLRPTLSGLEIQPMIEIALPLVRSGATRTASDSNSSTSTSTRGVLKLYKSDCRNGNRFQICDATPLLTIPIPSDRNEFSVSLPESIRRESMVALYTDNTVTAKLSRMFVLDDDIVLIGVGNPLTITTNPSACQNCSPQIETTSLDDDDDKEGSSSLTGDGISGAGTGGAQASLPGAAGGCSGSIVATLPFNTLSLILGMLVFIMPLLVLGALRSHDCSLS